MIRKPAGVLLEILGGQGAGDGGNIAFLFSPQVDEDALLPLAQLQELLNGNIAGFGKFLLLEFLVLFFDEFLALLQGL